MEKKKEGQVILKQWVKMTIIIVLSAVLTLGMYLMAKSIMPASEGSKKLATYSYNANINYKVYLKNNNFFDNKSLPMNGEYITSIIDYIEFNPRYDLQSTVPLNYEYNYQIIATAKSTFESNGSKSEVWSKAYNILPITKKTVSGTNLNINETVKVNYDTYNNILSDFKKQFGLNVKAEVDLTLRVSINATDSSNSKIRFNENNDLTLVVPLLTPTAKFVPNYTPEGTKGIYEQQTDSASFEVIWFILGLALLLLSIFLLIKAIKEFFIATNKSEYVLQFNKIMKNYSDIIAEADNVPDLDNYDVININNFDDLVDIEEELRIPILCIEIKADIESWFIILHDEAAYRYVLKHQKLLKNKRK